MITATHHMGWFNSLIVGPPQQPTGGAVMMIEIVDADDAGNPIKSYELLSRSDVERLRELCDEALS